MYGKLTLKESFLKRRISSYPKPADLTLSNGKVYDLSFILDEDIVEITNKKGEPIGKKLSQEERYAVIEAIIDELTTFRKSIKHFTIAYNMEFFRLVDATYVEDPELSEDMKNPGDVMLIELVKSKYAAKSRIVLYRILNEVYEILLGKFRADKLSGIIEIPIEFRLDKHQAMDLEYFTNQMINAKKWCLGLKHKASVNKDRTILTIEIEEELE